MPASPSNLETEQPVQSVDIAMPNAPDQSEDIHMPDAPEDRNVVRSEDGTQQFGLGRPQTCSVDQSNLCNSSDAMSRGGESIPHGQEDLKAEVNNRGDNAIQLSIIFVCHHGPQELPADAVHAAEEHQCSPYLDGEDTAIVYNVEHLYKCDRCKAHEESLRTAGQNNGH